MFHNNRFLNLVLWLALASIASGCTGGGCSGCSFSELPEGGVPASQTIESGAQIRITEDGLQTIGNVVTALLDDMIGGGFCLGQQMVIDDSSAVHDVAVGACYNDTCTAGGTGCDVDIDVTSFVVTPNPDSITVAGNFNMSTDIDIGASVWVIGLGTLYDDNCVLSASLPDALVSFDVSFSVNSGSGEMEIDFDTVNDFNLTGLEINGCGLLGDALDGLFSLLTEITSILTDELGFFFGPLLAELAESLLDQFLPDPLGLEGVLDVGAFLADFSPSTHGALETKLIPGGYAAVENSGISLGVITAFNSDRDPSTRTAADNSEPALCVPPIPVPKFGEAPHNLSTIARNYGNPFVLQQGGEFVGNPEPAADLSMGISETMLDLAGHHMVTSGAMCLSISTEAIEQFNLGTIGLVVPSFSELGSDDGKDPLMLVTRPLEALDFTIGEGTEADPALTVHLNDFEVDFYAFIFERWVRGFTISLDASIAINLEMTTDASGNPALLPTLSGLEAENLQITVLNEDFLRETATELEAVFPALLELALPLVAGALGEIALPDFGGFTLSDLTLGKVVFDGEDFLAVKGSLATTSAMGPLLNPFGDKFPKFVEAMKALEVPAPEKSDTLARLASISVPPPQAVRASLLARTTKVWPEVVIDVPEADGKGRALEYTWSLNGGLWRPFEPGGELVIRDAAFAIQGRYEILVRARRVGDYASLDMSPVRLPVVIDSAPPRIHSLDIEGSFAAVRATDLVSDNVRIAFSPVGADSPTTSWSGGELTVYELGALSDGAGAVDVWAEDEIGNQSKKTVDFDPHLKATGGCAAGGDGSTGGMLAMLGLLGWLGLGRRRRRSLLALARVRGRGLATAAAVIAIVLSPGCSCESGFTCELNEDCISQCEDGTIPICTEAGDCLCADDIPFGRVGQYSSMAVASGEVTWVSAYNSTHGDLMVAQWTGAGRIPDEEWTFVDGVPDGPVVIEGSDVRGGISDKGEDVGLYTDIAANGDIAHVSYFDRTTSSLKYATNQGGEWAHHIIEQGTPTNPEGSTFKTIGQYSSITLGPNGAPGIAYFVQIGSGGDATTEVRWAEAGSASPTGASSWTVSTIDSALVEGISPGGLSIPEGLGLFVNSTRLSDGRPVMVYYDRQNGLLKMALHDGSEFVVSTLDGGEGLDVGWYPSIVADSSSVLHVAYVDVINSDLLYINDLELTPELVDDGYRLVGTNADGLPKPEFHFVGDDSAIVITPAGPVIAYQNATTHELLVASKGEFWDWESLAGNESSFEGGFGFYARAESTGDEVVLSTWVIDQPNFDSWVEIFRVQYGVE